MLGLPATVASRRAAADAENRVAGTVSYFGEPVEDAVVSLEESTRRPTRTAAIRWPPTRTRRVSRSRPQVRRVVEKSISQTTRQ
ncbi:hypothetical protein D8S78_07140 [Natrialba swarupiae]|nr:hypothetical protein [Natrialba swarupiae]